MSRIVLFGASGYTGGLAARALVANGARPVLAGRRRDALEALAARFGGLETASADATQPDSLRRIVAPADVLVTTVGPMTRWGCAALEAAVDGGAHYIDSSGESAWVRQVFERAGPRAEGAGILALPAMAYDSVPGNLAAALALREAGPRARRVRVGYFVTATAGRGLRAGLRQMSGGSRDTFASMSLARGFTFRGGRLVTERASARVGRFELAGRALRGVSFGTSEAFSLPRLFPSLTDVEVYFGWFDRASRLIQAAALPLAAVAAAPLLRRTALALSERLPRRSGAAPADRSSGSLFVAEALEGDTVRARIVLEGINGYEFSGNMLAWAASRVRAGAAHGAGALGPVEAFGLEALEAGVAAAGIARSAT
jgi:hypothetical protein